MKRFKFLLTVGLIFGLLLGISSCYVAVRKDRGLHKGHYKNLKYKNVPPGKEFQKKKHNPWKWPKGPLPKKKGRK